MIRCTAALLAALTLGANSPQTPQRPRDPWVFRCVLDQRARMVGVALSNELWVAYDATSCGLYKAWKGGVRFDGAVYTTVHGPQPTSVGPAYLGETEGEPWAVENADGTRTPLAARWRGYAFRNAQVHLKYELTLPDGARVEIEETPEFVRPQRLFDDPASQAPWMSADLVGLRRTFTANGIPAGVRLSLAARADCVGYLMEPLAALEDVEVTLPDGSVCRRVDARLSIDAAKPTLDWMVFFRPPAEAKR